MTDAKKSPEVTAAEAKLKDLERFRRAVADANIVLQAANLKGDKDEIAVAQAAFDQAEKTEKGSGISQRDIDVAGQAVLDARGESHTEENILPPDLGSKTAEAEFDVAMARSRQNPKLLKAAEARLEEAVASDTAERAAHIQASTERTLANLEGAKS